MFLWVCEEPYPHIPLCGHCSCRIISCLWDPEVAAIHRVRLQSAFLKFFFGEPSLPNKALTKINGAAREHYFKSLFLKENLRLCLSFVIWMSLRGFLWLTGRLPFWIMSLCWPHIDKLPEQHPVPGRREEERKAKKQASGAACGDASSPWLAFITHPGFGPCNC